VLLIHILQYVRPSLNSLFRSSDEISGLERLTPIPFKWAQVTASCYLGFAENRGNQEAATRMPRGQCTLPADEAGRILDRLAGLEQVIRPEDMRQALTATRRISVCDCVLTYEVILWVVLAMGLLTDLPIRQVFKHARRLRAGEESPPRSKLCMARRRCGTSSPGSSARRGDLRRRGRSTTGCG
jgi:hypothetical protein